MDRRPDGSLEPSTVYWMNSLQNASKKRNYFVSINGADRIRGDAIIRDIEYMHPAFTVGSARAQRDLPNLNRDGVLYFCGAYFRYGFHEDGLTSALDLARTVMEEPVWPGAPGLSAS
jgi:predicted NAD/FAD-binding protein